ncbi:hypothetical protein Q8F55_009159 [Vanrija albida]|uniref:Uncharacterized protein n=1 Tax=Vanrija albida TaxID=181172 RepID=A0ABR3PSU3_9TREE
MMKLCTYSETVPQDLSRSNVYQLISRWFFWLALRRVQEDLFLVDSITSTSWHIRSVCKLLSLSLQPALGEVPHVNTAGEIDRKLLDLFERLPREQPSNIRAYGFRCGIVFGVLASYESAARGRRSRKYLLGSAAVTGASSAIENLPNVNGVDVGKVMEPAATGVRGVLLEILGWRRQRLGAGVSLVEYMFLTHVIGQANEGLPGSYDRNKAIRDAEGNILPAFTGEQMRLFKETAWTVFQIVMNDEGHQIGFTLPPEALEAPQFAQSLSSKKRRKMGLSPRLFVDHIEEFATRR